MRATPPGTGNASEDTLGPILWRAWVTPGRRNARKGVGHHLWWLKVRANPLGNQASTIRPDKSRCGGTSIAGWYS